MSPEYLILGRFSEKSDVFSFGVMVLEIITGKKNSSSYDSNRITYDLLSYVSRIIISCNLVLYIIFNFLYATFLIIIHIDLKNCYRFGDNGMIMSHLIY